MGFWLSWLIVGGIIGYVGNRALKLSEYQFPVRAASKPATSKLSLNTIPQEEEAPRMTIDKAPHPDLLNARLEESFQEWAKEQQEKNKEEEQW